jgi:hypothetical protein
MTLARAKSRDRGLNDQNPGQSPGDARPAGRNAVGLGPITREDRLAAARVAANRRGSWSVVGCWSSRPGGSCPNREYALFGTTHARSKPPGPRWLSPRRERGSHTPARPHPFWSGPLWVRPSLIRAGLLWERASGARLRAPYTCSPLHRSAGSGAPTHSCSPLSPSWERPLWERPLLKERA